MRNAPSIDIIKALQDEGAKIKAYDPQAVLNAKKYFKGITYSDNPYMCAKGCDCLLLLTEWQEFVDLDFERIAKSMRQLLLFDGRNFYHDRELQKHGFEYHGIGIGNRT